MSDNISNNRMKRVAIYCRVSDPNEAKEGKLSFQRQEDECRKWLDQIGGYEVTQVIHEKGVSGYKYRRPGMDHLLDLAEARQIDAVCLARVDRFSRDLVTDGLLIGALEEYRIEVLYAGRDHNTQEGQVFIGFEKLAAQWERGRTRDRLQGGRLVWLKNNRFIAAGCPPYGYQYDIGRKMYVIYEPEARWVPLMFRWVGEEGLSMCAAVRRLNQYGVPTKRNSKGWTTIQLSKILGNTIYYGKASYNKQKTDSGGRMSNKETRTKTDPSTWIYVDVPDLALVSRELWDAANARRDPNKRYGGRTELPYLLRAGHLKCSHCGYVYYAAQSSKKRVYRCTGKNPEKRMELGWDQCIEVLDNVQWGVSNSELYLLQENGHGIDPCEATDDGWTAETAFGTGLFCFLLYPSDPVMAIRRAAVTKGDSDSIAALAGAFAGAHQGLAGWPPDWLERIEYRDRIANLASHFEPPSNDSTLT